MLIGIKNTVCLRQVGSWQMMVGNKHFNTVLPGPCNTFNTGYTIINRNNKCRLSLFGNLDNFGGKPIAELKTVRHQIIDIAKTEIFQAEEQ